MSRLLLVSPLVFLLCSCEPVGNVKAQLPVVPIVKTDCINDALFLEESKTVAGSSPVAGILNHNDTTSLRLGCFPKLITFTPAIDTSEKHYVQVSETSILEGRITNLTSPYPFMDSLSVYVDTSQILNVSLYYNYWGNDELPKRLHVTRAYPVFIKNLSKDTVKILEDIGLNLQVKNVKGEWGDYMRSDVYCSTGMNYYCVGPSDYIVALIPLTNGKFRKEIRIGYDQHYSQSYFANCNFGF